MFYLRKATLTRVRNPLSLKPCFEFLSPVNLQQPAILREFQKKIPTPAKVEARVGRGRRFQALA
jgi:hypothetical protein